MSSEGVMIQEATPEILSTLNPAQYNTTNNPNIKRMFADLGVELSQAPTVVEPQALVEPESSGILSQIKSLFNKEDDTVSSNVAPSPMTSEITPDQPPVVKTGNPFNLPDPTTKIGEFAQGILTMPSNYYDAGKFLFNKQADLGKAIVRGVVDVPEYIMSPSEQLQQSKEDFRAEEERLMNLRGGLNTMSITEGEVAAKKAEDEIKRLEAEDKAKTEKEQTAAAAADKLNPQGPNFVLNPDKIKKDLDEGGSGSNALLNVEIDKKLSPKESVKEFQSMYKEMLGMDDKDKEKEKWHQMAMIGFAIAAGQDPNALSNIAGGLLEGTKMARKDRVRKKDRDDKFTMMAIQSADEDRRTALAAGVRADERSQDQLNRIALTDLETRQRLKDESRKSKQSLQLYEDKLKIAQMFETPQSILKTDPAMAIISKAFDGVDYDMLGTGENAFSALEKMGFPKPQLKKFSRIVFPGEPYGGSGGVGKGVTGTGAKLTDIPD